MQIPNLDHHLLCPMQCRVNYITINNVPYWGHKNPLGGSTRKRTSEVAALQRSVRELSSNVGHYPADRTEDDRCRGQYPDKTDSYSNKNQPGLVCQSYSEKKQKGLGD